MHSLMFNAVKDQFHLKASGVYTISSDPKEWPSWFKCKMPMPIADGIYQDKMFNRKITFPLGQKGICQCLITALIQTSWISISFEIEQ